jgi:hypothetical protein
VKKDRFELKFRIISLWIDFFFTPPSLPSLRVHPDQDFGLVSFGGFAPCATGATVAVVVEAAAVVEVAVCSTATFLAGGSPIPTAPGAEAGGAGAASTATGAGGGAMRPIFVATAVTLVACSGVVLAAAPRTA